LKKFKNTNKLYISFFNNCFFPEGASPLYTLPKAGKY